MCLVINIRNIIREEIYVLLLCRYTTWDAMLLERQILCWQYVTNIHVQKYTCVAGSDCDTSNKKCRNTVCVLTRLGITHNLGGV